MKPHFRHRLLEMSGSNNSYSSLANDHNMMMIKQEEGEIMESSSSSSNHSRSHNHNNDDAMLLVQPDGCLSVTSSTAPSSSFRAIPRVSISEYTTTTKVAATTHSQQQQQQQQQRQDFGDLTTLVRQIEATRSSLAQEDQEYMQAKLNEANINQTLLTLTNQRQELKEKLQRTRDEVNIAKEEQEKAAAVTSAKEQTKKDIAATLDGLMAQLYKYQARKAAAAAATTAATAMVASPRPPSKPQVEEEAAAAASPSHSQPIPRRNSSLRGDRRPREEEVDSGSPPPKKSKSSTNASSMTAAVNNNKTKVKKSFTRSTILNLSADAAAGDTEAKAKLIQVVTTTPRRELREIMGIQTKSHCYGLDSYLTLDLMRALVRGRADQRTDLKARLAKAENVEIKRWLMGTSGKLTVGHVKADIQERINFILMIPSSSH